MTDRKHMIEPHETLTAIVVSRVIKRSYLTESSFFGAAMDAAEVLDNLTDDEIVTVLRVDTIKFSVEDITEEVAQQFLFAMDEKTGITLDDEDTFPLYVKDSVAWKRWRDDLEAEEPVSAVPYSTMNHASQGLQSVERRTLAYLDAGMPGERA